MFNSLQIDCDVQKMGVENRKNILLDSYQSLMLAHQPGTPPSVNTSFVPPMFVPQQDPFNFAANFGKPNILFKFTYCRNVL